MITLLCDSHGIGYRAAHSTGSLDSGIAFGFLTTILQLSERYHTNQFIFCWDGPGSLRKRLFPEYKISRTVKTQEEVAERIKIHTQFDSLHNEILPIVGFSNHHFLPGYEADDLIAQTLIDNPDRQFIIVSSDHDLFQLLQYKNCKGQHLFCKKHHLLSKLMTASGFMAEYRVPAREWVSVKSIAGCDGDGVPGVPGIGEKTAIKFLMNELPDGKKKEAIHNHWARIHSNFKLVRLPFPGVRLNTQIRKDQFNEESVQETFSDLGFHSFLAGEQRKRWDMFCRGEFL